MDIRQADDTGGVMRQGDHRHPPEWERARVKRWLEIVSVDKMGENKSTQLRAREFEERYARLEAEVPTP